MEVQTRSHVQWTEWKTSLRKKYITTFTTTCNRCKKPITIYCRYPALSLKAHLRSCPASTNNLLEKHKLKKKSRIKEIWNYYDVIDDMTVCKRCKRPIKADDRVTSNLHTHARICGNIEKRKRKVTQILDKFDITGDKAKCKGCRKTLKVCGKYPAPNLANHLKYCRPPKFDEFGREIKESLKISHLWDEYDITGDQATCKGCKKIVKVNSKFPRSNLFRHFRSCPRVEVDLLKKDEVKTIRRLSQIWEKFDEDGDMMICKQCKKAIKMSNAKTTSSLHSHLRHCRQTPEKTNIWDNFDVTGDKATCKGCKKTIKVNSKYPRVSVYRHFNSCPLVNKEPNKLEKKRILSKLWEKYNIIGIATCKQCKKTVEVNNKCPKISLKQHLRYCQSSTSDQSDKCKSKKKQKILKLRDKYDIIYKTATCIHCNKIIKLKQRKLNSKTITSALNLHFRICRVSEDGLKKIRRRSQLWDKLNVTGNKATCKGCNKTVKVTSRFPTRNIASHLKHCPVFAYNRLDTRKPEVTRQISEPWDKYDVTGDTATCKGCKETIKLNSETPTANLNEHLEYCRSSENNDMDKYKLEKIRRKSILWTKFDVTGDRAVCKQCKKSVKVNAKLPTVNLNHHFRCCQLKKELKYMM
ncbi:PREDICTED: uncharacterized protein LOC105564576 isoform X2 [Vollenhovia emeryi]|nr:PREDICTED: uncharacterized protein LOC105564576 isoform X2 [Vollenhovia emeryi]XP_011872429.1 PREDICTED: uncharacterized protein LOC105564576 isoform X2 [Vollenhovia emeryi]XP_011872430.1 PREDICTED: uncharacterized protein LOC105564576 isoform X2 [Vollenhovia emeryi]XP_011872431.1 PREDICTED: uncharacterized protein LOC105564576 isoform X2 [Vollenhovia emeryi]XP_011872432.1 PREDICTED: uncharacterized protein LOC105564576 isoform X2 [Vollenhovia emeryi]